MRDAILADLAAIPGIVITYTTMRDAALPRIATASASPACPEDGESATDFVRRHAALHDCAWIVAPETGGILADLRNCVGDARWIGCSVEAIRTASSKRRTVQQLRAFGVPTTREANSSVVDADTRWVVKPDDGAGACNTRVHRSLASALDDRNRRASCREEARVEVWEEGQARSLSLMCGSNDVELLSVNRQRIDIADDGGVHYGGVDIDVARCCTDPALAQLARDVARAIPGLAGYVGVDVVMRRDGAPVVIEVNPRVTCAYVGLSAALGRNLARDVLAVHNVDFERTATVAGQIAASAPTDVAVAKGAAS